MVGTVDTDVIILFVTFMFHLMSINYNVESFCDFGTSIHRKLIMINPMFRDLTENGRMFD